MSLPPFEVDNYTECHDCNKYNCQNADHIQHTHFNFTQKSVRAYEKYNLEKLREITLHFRVGVSHPALTELLKYIDELERGQ